MEKQTLALHSGYDSLSGYGTMAVPIYFNTAYNFGTADMAADRFTLKDLGYIYSRLSNPTTDVFQKRLAALEGGSAAVATSSGQAAVFATMANLVKSGDTILMSDKVYGGTVTLLTSSLANFGVKTKVFDAENTNELESLIDDTTKAILFETLSNPQISIADVDSIVSIANKYDIVTVADNTVLSPALYNPIKDGVDVVIHSASKYISGQGLSIAGAVVSSPKLNEKLKNNSRYPLYNEPDETYHGLVYSDFTDSFDIFSLRLVFRVLRDFGMTISPFNSFQLIQGLETLDLRMEKHSKNALEVAEFLANHPKVKSVTYPGLKNSKGNKIAKEKFKDGLSSGLLCFEVENYDIAKEISDKTKIFSVVVNIGDSKSIITHPASTTHSQLSQSELKTAGISSGLIRLSVGLESAKDLIADLKQALD
ncbi:O-acetylhomoserine aminocarboxypropyltransferase/cysteine synthase family protein [Campylobacter corcagiensis]|uniref:Aminotransferase class V-fold PLP-dependent enzyme n=1 Tax=Campylobacter corcagiensis TaxID=1448857 RepID=A0A7M1LIL6_9BACT|nr:aminotransferase class I/II-fold pyridoxal phosphate-dependent enzyme [Campylobacter corcagiensis]QKF64472.1 O-acetylhomoserine sulfhydrylase [Campylobacter corcagiensis]QOQ87345.1 aminotransferase class V-fold PLP-dependent enzyme [Campylobacter corcagiensis]